MWHEDNKEQLSPLNLHKQMSVSLAISVLVSVGARWEWAGAEDSVMWEELESKRWLQNHQAEIVQPGEAGQKSHCHSE